MGRIFLQRFSRKQQPFFIQEIPSYRPAERAARTAVDTPVGSPAVALDFGQISVYPKGVTTIPDSVQVNTEAAYQPGRAGDHGKPLDADTRNFMEQRFGYDFDHVRLHTDAGAADSASMLNARAYTIGNDVVLGHGFSGSTAYDGRRLLAHELTHIVQQGGADRWMHSGVNPGCAPTTLSKLSPGIQRMTDSDSGDLPSIPGMEPVPSGGLPSIPGMEPVPGVVQPDFGANTAAACRPKTEYKCVSNITITKPTQDTIGVFEVAKGGGYICFHTNRTDLALEDERELDKIQDYIWDQKAKNTRPTADGEYLCHYHIHIVGHADYRGPASLNQELAMRRASTIEKYYKDRLSSDDVRITTDWQPESDPVPDYPGCEHTLAFHRAATVVFEESCEWHHEPKPAPEIPQTPQDRWICPYEGYTIPVEKINDWPSDTWVLASINTKVFAPPWARDGKVEITFVLQNNASCTQYGARFVGRARGVSAGFSINVEPSGTRFYTTRRLMPSDLEGWAKVTFEGVNVGETGTGISYIDLVVNTTPEWISIGGYSVGLSLPIGVDLWDAVGEFHIGEIGVRSDRPRRSA